MMKRLLVSILIFILLLSPILAQEMLSRESPFFNEQIITQKALLTTQKEELTVKIILKEETDIISTASIVNYKEQFIEEKNPTYVFSDQRSLNIRVSLEELEELHNNPLIEEIIFGEPIFTQITEATNIIQAPQTWDIITNNLNLTGKGQTICIIDTGLDYTHPDLGGCVGPECKVLAVFNSIDSTTNVTDIDGHGTHVAGIAAANGLVRGSAPDANIVGVKALFDTGTGSTIDVAAGIDWCVSNKEEYNISIISMSLGTQETFTTACTNSFWGIREQISRALAQNITVLAASGNNGFSNAITAPACIPGVIPVGSTTKNDQISFFSNLNNLVTLLAPGSSIQSTLPSSAYGIKSGTSMATPLVAGAYAVIQQHFYLTGEQKSAQEIEELFFETSNVLLEELDNIYARINLLEAVSSLKQAPQTRALFPQTWQKETFNVTLEVTFNNTAINFTTYSINQGPWVNGTIIPIETEGNNTVEFYSVDVAANIEPTNTVFALLDLSAPNTTTNASANWTQATTIFLNATDELSGINFTTYQINDANWINETTIFFNQTGNYTLFYYSVDNAGNVEQTKNVTVLIDTTPPSIQISKPSGWQNESFLINWSANDEHSGMQNLTYQKNDGLIQKANNVTIDQEGNQTIIITAKDNAQNIANKTIYALLDTTPPNTTIINNISGWFRTNTTIFFSATDNLSGINVTQYHLGDNNWTNNTNVTLSDGNYTLFYRSIDIAGNTEQTKNVTILIDTIAPIIQNISLSEARPQASNNFTITANITDENLANATITINEETTLLTRNKTLFNITLNLSQGTYSAIIQAYDLAGNSAEQEILFTVYTTLTKNNIELNDTIIQDNSFKSSLRIKTNNPIITNITIRETTQSPADKTILERAFRFITIDVPQSAQEQINWSIITINYTLEELEMLNLNESTITPKYYNHTTNNWDDLLSKTFVNSVILNTTTKQLIINTTRFSTYALSAQENQEPTPTTPSISGPSGGGGGGGSGGGAPPIASAPSNSSTQSISFLRENNLVNLRFHNELLAIKELSFIPLQDSLFATITLKRKPLPQNAPAGSQEYYEVTYPQDLQVSNVSILYVTNMSNPILYARIMDDWQKLEQEQIINDTFRASSDFLSSIILAQRTNEEESIQEADILEDLNNQTIQQENNREEPEAVVSIQEEVNSNYLTIILLILIVIFIFGFIFFLRKK